MDFCSLVFLDGWDDGLDVVNRVGECVERADDIDVIDMGRFLIGLEVFLDAFAGVLSGLLTQGGNEELDIGVFCGIESDLPFVCVIRDREDSERV